MKGKGGELVVKMVDPTAKMQVEMGD